MKAINERWSCVSIHVNKHKNLEMKLTREGRAYAKELLLNEDFDANTRLWELLEDLLCNGWDWIRPEEIGALTSAPIISNDAERDDNGELVSLDHCWGYMDYQIFDPVEQLLKGKIIWQNGDD